MNAPDAPLASLRSPVRQMAASRHHKPTLKSRLAANAENRPPTATRDERPAGSITPHPIRWDSVVESPESTFDVAAALADVSEPESNASMERAREATRKSETAPKNGSKSGSSPSPTTRTSTKRKSIPTTNTSLVRTGRSTRVGCRRTTTSRLCSRRVGRARR